MIKTKNFNRVVTQHSNGMHGESRNVFSVSDRHVDSTTPSKLIEIKYGALSAKQTYLFTIQFNSGAITHPTIVKFDYLYFDRTGLSKYRFDLKSAAEERKRNKNNLFM